MEGRTGRCGTWSPAVSLCLQAWWSPSASSPTAGSWTFCVGAPSASSPTSRAPPPRSSSPLPSESRVQTRGFSAVRFLEPWVRTCVQMCRTRTYGRVSMRAQCELAPCVSSGVAAFLPSCWRVFAGDRTPWLRAASLLRVALSTETAATHTACWCRPPGGLGFDQGAPESRVPSGVCPPHGAGAACALCCEPLGSAAPARPRRPRACLLCAVVIVR